MQASSPACHGSYRVGARASLNPCLTHASTPASFNPLTHASTPASLTPRPLPHSRLPHSGLIPSPASSPFLIPRGLFCLSPSLPPPHPLPHSGLIQASLFEWIIQSVLPNADEALWGLGSTGTRSATARFAIATCCSSSRQSLSPCPPEQLVLHQLVGVGETSEFSQSLH